MAMRFYAGGGEEDVDYLSSSSFLLEILVVAPVMGVELLLVIIPPIRICNDDG
jgi:hypothetical protein